MAKEWFQHDYGTRNKKKLAALIQQEGSWGYGLFWIIAEMLYEDRRKKMELDENTYLAIKKESGEDIKHIREFIIKCIDVYRVFKKVGKYFFSTERVLENAKFRKNIFEKKSKAGIQSGKSRRKMRTDVEHNLTDVQADRTQESTVQESTGEEKRESIAEPKISSASGPVPEMSEQARAPGLSNSNLFRKPKIPTWDQVYEVFIRSGGTEEMAKSFWQKHEGTGWFINGSPIVNFPALAQKFIENWKANETKETKKEIPIHMQTSGGPKLTTL